MLLNHETPSNILINPTRCRHKKSLSLPEECRGLRLFIEKEEELDIATADQAIREVKATWPQVQGVTADGILMLKKGLLVSGAMLPYRLVLPFISEGCHRLNRLDEKDEQSLAVLVREVIESAERMLPPTATTPISAP